MANITPAISRKVLDKIKGFISEGASHCEDKHSRIEENQLYVGGEQWKKGDVERQRLRDRPAIPWNSVFKIVNSICNREVVERFSPKVFGRSESDPGLANVLDETCRWQRQMSMSEHYESMAFRSAGIGGYGVMHKYWAPTAMNGDGMTLDEDVPPWEMLWPARAREMNLSDRQWHVRGKWMGVDYIEALWGDVSPKIKKKVKKVKKEMEQKFGGTESALPGTSKGMSGSWMGWQVVASGNWVNTATKELFVAEAEWREIEYQYRAAVPRRFDEWATFMSGAEPFGVPNQETGEMVPFTLDNYLELPDEQQREIQYLILSDTVIEKFETLQELNGFADRYMDLFGMEFDDVHKQGKETIRFAVVVDEEVISYGRRPWGFSYYFITGFPIETRDGMDFVGIVDIVKGPQDYKNSLLSNMLSMYMSSPKAPLFMEKSLSGQVGDLADRLASPSAFIELPDGALQGGKMQFGDQPSYPPMLEPLLRLTDAGVETTMGMADLTSQTDLRRISGKVVQAAAAASNVVVAILFDALRKFRKEYGMCNVKFMTYMFPSPEEILRIVGEEKAEDVASIEDGWGDILRYDITIDEQPASPTEQMEAVDYLTRTGMLEQMWMRGDISTEDVLDLMPIIPEAKKRKILKGKTQREQMAQLQAMLQENTEFSNSLVQMIQSSEGGEQLLASFNAMWQQRQQAKQVQAQAAGQQ